MRASALLLLVAAQPQVQQSLAQPHAAGGSKPILSNPESPHVKVLLCSVCMHVVNEMNKDLKLGIEKGQAPWLGPELMTRIGNTCEAEWAGGGDGTLREACYLFVRGSAQRVFDAVQERWLPASDAFEELMVPQPLCHEWRVCGAQQGSLNRKIAQSEYEKDFKQKSEAIAKKYAGLEFKSDTDEGDARKAPDAIRSLQANGKAKAAKGRRNQRVAKEAEAQKAAREAGRGGSDTGSQSTAKETAPQKAEREVDRLRAALAAAQADVAQTEAAFDAAAGKAERLEEELSDAEAAWARARNPEL